MTQYHLLQKRGGGQDGGRDASPFDKDVREGRLLSIGTSSQGSKAVLKE